MYATTTTAGGSSTADPRGYIESVWGSYLALWPKILDAMHEAAELKATTPAGSLDHEAAGAALENLRRLAKLHTATVRKVEELGEYVTLGGAGLGAVPVAVLAAFSALAAVIAWSFRQYEAQRQVLDMIAAGTLTPDEAVRLQEAGPEPPTAVLGGLGIGVGGLALLALAAFLILNRWRDNPDLLVFHENPPDGVWSHRVYEVRYRHDDNRENYKHTFRPGVRLQGLPDGSVRLYHPSRPLWRDFD